MTADTIFTVVNLIAVAGWLILIIAGGRRWAASMVSGVVAPLLFAVAYSGLIAAHWVESEGGFGTLTEVMTLFSNRWLVLAGWIHYLAFDLFVGSWEVRDAQLHGIPRLVVIPCLILTFLFGPAGFLLYYVVRFARTRSLPIETA